MVPLPSAAPSQVSHPSKHHMRIISLTEFFSAHMLVAEWDFQLGWKAPRIVPFGSLALSPAANVLHYSSTCFEGMKAYRGIDEKIRLFRPSMNMARFNRSAARIGLPTVDEDGLLKLIWKLIEVDQHFVPKRVLLCVKLLDCLLN